MAAFVITIQWILVLWAMKGRIAKVIMFNIIALMTTIVFLKLYGDRVTCSTKSSGRYTCSTSAFTPFVIAGFSAMGGLWSYVLFMNFATFVIYYILIIYHNV